MTYSELIQAYFERSAALQWYWTIYILVIGGVLGFSTFRQHKEIVTTILVTLLYGCFAYKNLGAIESTTEERNAILEALKDYPANDDVTRVRRVLESKLTGPEYTSYPAFHIVCDLMTIAVVWVKEFHRRKPAPGVATA
jgi:TctA family transporter